MRFKTNLSYNNFNLKTGKFSLFQMSLISRLSRIYLLILFSAGIFYITPVTLYSQEYGLEFIGKQFSKDSRTNLDLNPGGYYSFHGKFELSFSILMRQKEFNSFGYVVRLIDQNKNNVDVIFNGPEDHSLQIINGQEHTNISVPDSLLNIYENWTELKLLFDLKNIH